MKKLAIASSLIGLVLLTMACGSKDVSSEKVIKSASAGNNLTVSLATSDGVLRHGSSQFNLAFTDSSGKSVDVGAVALTFHMPQMGTMQAMNDAATFTTTETPVVYRGKVNLGMAGEWRAQIAYVGPAGRGQVSLPVTAR